jgi:hypothetical protein
MIFRFTLSCHAIALASAEVLYERRIKRQAKFTNRSISLSALELTSLLDDLGMTERIIENFVASLTH